MSNKAETSPDSGQKGKAPRPQSDRARGILKRALEHLNTFTIALGVFGLALSNIRRGDKVVSEK